MVSDDEFTLWTTGVAGMTQGRPPLGPVGRRVAARMEVPRGPIGSANIP